jgi:hypothetical protein
MRRWVPIASVLSVIALVIVAIALIGGGSSRREPNLGPEARSKTFTYSEPQGTYCGEPVAARDVSRPRVLARGTPPAWTLLSARVRLKGIRPFAYSLFRFGGQSYIACLPAPAPVVTAGHGRDVLWLMSPDVGVSRPIRLTVSGVPSSAVQHASVLADTKLAGTFFVVRLPKSMCSAPSISFATRGETVGQNFTLSLPRCAPNGTSS